MSRLGLVLICFVAADACLRRGQAIAAGGFALRVSQEPPRYRLTAATAELDSGGVRSGSARSMYPKDHVDLCQTTGQDAIAIRLMDPSGIDYRDYKKRHGWRLTFLGNIDITWPLVEGTPADVERNVKERMAF